MDRLLFGDNQFFGVNHMSEEKARSQQIKFNDSRAMMNVIDDAYDEGVRTFMCTTHERVAEICAIARSDRRRYSELTFMPCMPYAHKYANAVTEHGMMGALKQFTPTGGFIDAAFRGSTAVVRKEVDGLITLLIDSEMKMFAGLPTPVIWLQNVVTDLMLGLGFDDAFSIFAQHVREKYGAEPGFITMNLPQLLDRLERVGVVDPLVCANINKIGFRMSGGIEAYRRYLTQHRVRVVAMSVLASGAIPADEAIAWICEQPGIEAILFGASSRVNITSTRSLVDRYWKQVGV